MVTKKRQATRRKTSKPPKREFQHYMSWFITGLVMGCLLTASVVFYLQSGPDEKVQREKRKRVTVYQDEKQYEPITDFEFYDILPEKQVPLPRTDKGDKNRGQRADKKQNLILQVASFRRLSDADSVKASLALLGLEADIKSFKLDNNEIWHRVRLGPFNSRKEMDTARKLLKENKFDALELKLK